VAADQQPETVTADELRKLQAAMGLHTQREFADALGVRQSYVSMLLSGAREVKPGGPLMKLIRQLQAEHRGSKGAAVKARHRSG
jgi:transcriptional regulator with XRE-family HTH domain